MKKELGWRASNDIESQHNKVKTNSVRTSRSNTAGASYSNGFIYFLFYTPSRIPGKEGQVKNGLLSVKCLVIHVPSWPET